MTDRPTHRQTERWSRRQVYTIIAYVRLIESDTVKIHGMPTLRGYAVQQPRKNTSRRYAYTGTHDQRGVSHWMVPVSDSNAVDDSPVWCLSIFTARLYASAVHRPTLSSCSLSVRSSVTNRCPTETAEHRMTRYDSQETPNSFLSPKIVQEWGAQNRNS